MLNVLKITTLLALQAGIAIGAYGRPEATLLFPIYPDEIELNRSWRAWATPVINSLEQCHTTPAHAPFASVQDTLDWLFKPEEVSLRTFYQVYSLMRGVVAQSVIHIELSWVELLDKDQWLEFFGDLVSTELTQPQFRLVVDLIRSAVADKDIESVFSQTYGGSLPYSATALEPEDKLRDPIVRRIAFGMLAEETRYSLRKRWSQANLLFTSEQKELANWMTTMNPKLRKSFLPQQRTNIRERVKLLNPLGQALWMVLARYLGTVGLDRAMTKMSAVRPNLWLSH